MTPYYDRAGITVFQGDCLEALRKLADNSVDSVITDPPYELTSGGNKGFMGQVWDGSGIAFNPKVWCECLRVAKPGATLMAFGGTRTYHRLACAIEDAGWEIRDCISYFHDGTQQQRAFLESLNEEQLGAYLELHRPANTLCWTYGSGFPKAKRVNEAANHLVSKGDACQCAENKNNSGNTYPLQNVLDRICKVGSWELKGRDAYSNGHYGTNKPQDFQGGYHHVSHSYDEFLRRATMNVLTFLLPQEYVREHNHSFEFEGGQDFLPLHTLCRVLYNDLRANKDYFHLSQIQPVLQLLQGYEDENTPLSNLREMLSKLAGTLNVSELLDGDKLACRNIHIYSLVFCLPLSILRIVNSRKYNTIIPQMVICGNCGNLYNIWDGYTSHALKPAHEPIVVAMKPLDGTYANNAQVWGVSGLWIDGGRVGTRKRVPGGISIQKPNANVYGKYGIETGNESGHNPNIGRWPANCIHDNSDEVLAEFDKAGVRKTSGQQTAGRIMNSGMFGARMDGEHYGDTGTPARFFQQCPPDPPTPYISPCLDCQGCVLEDDGAADEGLVSKGRWPANCIHDNSEEVLAEFDKAGVSASSDRPRKREIMTSKGVKGGAYGNPLKINHNGYDGFTHGYDDSGTPSRFFAKCPPDSEPARFRYCPKAGKRERGKGNNHPTVKPLSLLKYLCRITRTPTGGIVLDPFAGSGTTGLAARAEGRQCILIEKEPDYCEIITNRLEGEEDVSPIQNKPKQESKPKPEQMKLF